MVQHASQAVCLGCALISSAHDETAMGFSLPDNPHYGSLLWYSWILAESIRRTWAVAATLQAIYLTQRDTTAPCLGGMMITTRQGVWEAQSAVVWEKLCSDVEVGLLQMCDVDKLFTQATPEDVDDFAKAILETAFGVDRMERWGVQITT